MRLSMWVLYDWLREYEPVSKIEDGERVLRNVRLFSDELKPSRTTVYLSGIDEKTVMCMNGHDILLLHAADITDVFNSILDAFDYYNDWSAALYEKIDNGCDVHEMLEAGCQLLKRFVILADATFFVRDTAGDLEGSSRNEMASRVVRERLMPVDILLKINEQAQIRKPLKEAYYVDTPGVDVRTVVTNLFSEGRHKGWLVTENAQNLYTQGDLDLQSAFTEIFCDWMEKEGFQEEQMEKTELFLELLKGEPADDELLFTRMAGFQWYKDDRKVIYVIQQTDKGRNPQHIIERLLKGLEERNFVFSHEGMMIYLANLELSGRDTIEADMKRFLIQCGCIAGRSPEFRDIRKLSPFFHAARIAAEYPSGPDIVISGFQDAVLPYICNLIKTNTVTDVRHPAAVFLEQYDQEHGTEYNRTVFVFLKHMGSYTNASEELCIHRSTLLYRLERIEKLTGVTFQDYHERLHLMLTYLMEE